jgi:hypothetical protein
LDETRDVISIQNDDLLGLRFSKEEILNDFNHSVVAIPPKGYNNMSIASIGGGNSSTLMEPNKHIRGLHYTMIPSVN